MRLTRAVLPWTVATLVAALVVAWPAGGAAAQPSGGWQLTGLHGYASRLFTPRSGALFAQQGVMILRSDDGGATWARVSVPPRRPEPNVPRVFTLDPTNHTVMYANGVEGLYRTTTDADSWSVALPTGEVVVSVTVSGADPSVLYAGLADRPLPESTRYRLVRSRDGGATWDELEVLGRDCYANINYLQAHPTDAQRIFRLATCNPGASIHGGLSESRDQGATWSLLFERAGYRPNRIVGGQGAAPERLYLQTFETGGASGLLLRSDDDGATWHELTPPWASLQLPPEAERVAIFGLEYDPAAPDRVYVALNVHQSNRTPGVRSFLFSRIMLSADGGQTWTDLGWGGESEVVDLKLGIDGKNLYAGAVSGVWRLALGGS